MGVSEVMGDPQVTTGFNTVGPDHHLDDHWGTPIDWKPPHRHHDILGSSSISRLFSTGKNGVSVYSCIDDLFNQLLSVFACEDWSLHQSESSWLGGTSDFWDATCQTGDLPEEPGPAWLPPGAEPGAHLPAKK